VHAELLADLLRALRTLLVKSREGDAAEIAKNARVMVAETADADDADPRRGAQNPTPR
jgi:hypothetical protein